MLTSSPNVFNIDKYALTVAYSWYKQNKHLQDSVYEVYYRKPPSPEAPFIVFGGTHFLLKYFKSFTFTPEYADYIEKELNIKDEGFKKFLISYNIDEIKIRSVQEGEFIYPNTPMITLKGKLGFIILMEAPFLSILHLCCSASTQSFLMKYHCDLPIIEMGVRRAFGTESAQMSSFYSVLNGFDSTSLVQSTYNYGVPSKGTMSHAFIMAFMINNSIEELNVCEDFLKLLKMDKKMFFEEIKKRRKLFGFEKTSLHELIAFFNFAMSFKNTFVALVDTYDVLRSGVQNFLLVATFLEDIGIEKLGIRLDSGDLMQDSIDSKKIMKEFDEKFNYNILKKTKVFASNDINLKFIKNLKIKPHSLDALGVGTKMSTFSDIKPIGIVYKLITIKNQGVMKFSSSIKKATIAFEKNIYKVKKDNLLYYLITRVDEKVSKGNYKGFELCSDTGKFIDYSFVIGEFELMNELYEGQEEFDVNKYKKVYQKGFDYMKKHKDCYLEKVVYSKVLIDFVKEKYHELNNAEY